MAMSLNGMTARDNQSEDFLSDTDWLLFLDLVRESDAVVWGRVTHELFEEPLRAQVPDLPIVVVTQDDTYAVKPGSTSAPSPQAAVELLEQRGSKRALLAGGATLNAGFARAGLIDHVVLAIEPVIVAQGRPLLLGEAPDMRLRLVGLDASKGSTLRVEYDVLHQ
jgi:dihydrofolate reductase